MTQILRQPQGEMDNQLLRIISELQEELALLEKSNATIAQELHENRNTNYSLNEKLHLCQRSNLNLLEELQACQTANLILREELEKVEAKNCKLENQNDSFKRANKLLKEELIQPKKETACKKSSRSLKNIQHIINNLEEQIENDDVYFTELPKHSTDSLVRKDSGFAEQKHLYGFHDTESGFASCSDLSVTSEVSQDLELFEKDCKDIVQGQKKKLEKSSNVLRINGTHSHLRCIPLNRRDVSVSSDSSSSDSVFDSPMNNEELITFVF